MSKKYTIEYMKELASKKNGKCLSEEYKNVFEYLLWECEKKHKWKTAAKSILNGSWCGNCAGHPVLDIAYCQEIAAKNGGKLLSNIYKDTKTKYNWECSEGHIFAATLDSVKYSKFWCKKCGGRENLTIESLQETAAKSGGKCLSIEYKGVGSYYDWECKYGHVWNAIGQNIRRGLWCPDCRGISMRNSIEDAIRLAETNEGKFLSKEYIKSDTKYLWQCKNNHTFEMSYHIVDSGSWCQYCVESKMERICRITFESIFMEKFIKIRPKWLIGFKNRSLELDGYCEKLNLAFEFNGMQHYKVIESFSMTEESLKEQQLRDKLKIQLCKENGTKLIIIKQEKDHMSQKEIYKSIILELEKESLIKIESVF
jgi:hypothetical protein